MSNHLPDAVYQRRRLATAGAALFAVTLAAIGLAQLTTDDSSSDVATANQTTTTLGATAPNAIDAAPSTQAPAALPTDVEIAAPRLTPDRAQGEPGSSGVTGLARVQTLGGEKMSPKSVVASTNGVVFAQNMMYHHSVSAFNADGALVHTIPDSVELEKFGITGHPGATRGAPVEMAFSPDGTTAWVSNYSMYGANFGPEGKDSCSPGDGTDESYLYRIDVATTTITNVIPVGAVPKYVAATPDGKRVLVTNWCTWDLSVIDTTTNAQVTRIKLGGSYPRGIVVSPDSTTAYVAVMGSDKIVTVDLASFAVAKFASPGDSPRHLVRSPDGEFIYVTNNRTGNVVKLDRVTGKTLGSVATGSEPRSMTIAPDGEAVYVVNYESGTMTKVRTSDMTIMQSVKTDRHPIGITYEPTKQRVWVACYGGTVLVFDDSRRITD